MVDNGGVFYFSLHDIKITANTQQNDRSLDVEHITAVIL